MSKSIGERRLDMDMMHAAKDGDNLKNDLIDKVLLVGTAIGFSVFLMSLFPLNEFVLNTDFFLDLFGLGFLFFTYLFRTKLSLKLKINIINSILILLLISDLFENGINTPDFVLLVLIPFFAILVYQFRTTLILFGACSLLFLGIGHLFHSGIISSPWYDVDSASIFRWYETLLMLSVLTFVITLFVSRFNTRVYNLIQMLVHHNDELEKNEGVIRESLHEKSVLLQEIHHRVKNNLAVVSGLLSLQSYHIEDPQLKHILGKNTNRILSIAKVHEMLYESRDFNNIPFESYIKELSDIIISSMNQEDKMIAFNTDISVKQLNINHGVPLGIIFNELITNSVKYGFTKMEGNEITIQVKEEGDSVKVVYRDNGIGIKDFEAATHKSLGFTLIDSLLTQIEAESFYETDNQFKLTFTFAVGNAETPLSDNT